MAARSAGALLLGLATSLGCISPARTQTVPLTPATMPQIGAVDERYQSYNVEMIEVTGGKFWRPYGPELDALLRQPAPPSDGDTPAGANPARYQDRPPIDLANPRLRKLAAALGPAYLRVSGTWANTTYFAETDEPPATPPAGFMGVLSRAQWEGVVAFAKAVDADIVTSFAIGAGTRDPAGAWTIGQAGRLLDYTSAVGGRIAAAEFMNEPNLAIGAPAGYDAAAYGRDFRIFHAFARQAAPEMLILGPGSVGETGEEGGPPGLRSRDLLAASSPATLGAFSYHHYGALSLRCAAGGTTAEEALSERWLGRTDQTLAFYRKLRDAFAPGRPLWLTETADAACGGNPWANTFLDTFRYLDQLGRLARQEVKVVAHNTLVASDYGLLNEGTLEPKPNYWGALLWRRLMGAKVLDAGVPIRPGLHLYAHCLRGTAGGVALLAINNSRTAPSSIELPMRAERYTLAAQDSAGTQVSLNGRPLEPSADDELPDLRPAAVEASPIQLGPASIAFLAVPDAGNSDCR